MAASSKARARAKAEGKTVEMFDEGEDGRPVKRSRVDRGAEAAEGEAEIKSDDRVGMDGEKGKGEGGKGQPGSPGKREESPEGGGVAGKVDRVKHKNAYEISMFWSGLIRAR